MTRRVMETEISGYFARAAKSKSRAQKWEKTAELWYNFTSGSAESRQRSVMATGPGQTSEAVLRGGRCIWGREETCWC